MRAEADQFLISCVELPNFIKWLDALFAAIDVAPAIDDREFPRDMSIPRVARIRYFRGGDGRAIDMSSPPITRQNTRATDSESSSEVAGTRVRQVPTDAPSSAPMLTELLPSRVSTTSYPNASIHPETGKWRPRHQWTSAHDMIYAKLCYSVLTFRSPRKSNYIIMKGKQWFVDWATGRMIRVLPPAYGEHEVVGPFQTFSAENRRI